jgi:uncharacterized protein (DUF433 family)
MKLTQILASATVAAVLGTGGVAIAGATTSGSSTPAPSTASASNNLNRKGIIKQNAKEALALAAKTIGISPADLVKALAQGKSIAQVATDHGSSGAAVISALVTAADAKVTAALNAHKISQAQATKIDARIPTVVANFVNKPHQHAVRADLRGLRRDAVQIAAKTIGIPAKQLVTEVKGGKTVAQVASDHGSSGTAVTSALVTAIDKKIDALVSAHKLTAAQGQAIEAKVPAKVANFVNNWHPKK